MFTLSAMLAAARARIWIRAGAIALVAAVTFATEAQAQNACSAPPGIAGIDQYCEAIPGENEHTENSPSSSGDQDDRPAVGGVPAPLAAQLAQQPGGPAALEALEAPTRPATTPVAANERPHQPRGNADRSAPDRVHARPAPPGLVESLGSASGSVFEDLGWPALALALAVAAGIAARAVERARS